MCGTSASVLIPCVVRYDEAPERAIAEFVEVLCAVRPCCKN